MKASAGRFSKTIGHPLAISSFTSPIASCSFTRTKCSSVSNRHRHFADSSVEARHTLICVSWSNILAPAASCPLVTHHGGASSSPRPDTVRDYRRDHEVYEGRKQTGRRSAHAGSRLKLSDAPGRSRLIRQPSSRTGENPPYGMIGGIEETSASFEARSAPRSYPTNSDIVALIDTLCSQP